MYFLFILKNAMFLHGINVSLKTKIFYNCQSKLKKNIKIVYSYFMCN
jgi:hypothetical protein